MQNLDVNQLYQHWLAASEKDQSLQLIDVRTPAEYAAVRVPGAKLIPLSALIARANEVCKDGNVYMICKVGGRSAQAIMFLAQQFGHDNLINIAGGTDAWLQSGYPIEKDAAS